MSRVETLLSLALIVATLLPTYVGGSEFPERECCDPVYPIPEPTSRAPSAPTPTGRSGPNIKTAVAILNCLFARQLCFEDPSCSAILEIIPRVCGPELVACSTVTVTKCQAALKTLQAFPFFRPTCLCREPHVDPECNSFRDFLFDHPCVYVLKKDKDPYPIDALPTCNHALSVCQRGKTCTKLFEDFKTNCKARDGKCRMENRDACHDAWTQLRLSPMFGCICPNNHMKRRCDRIFSMVNHNPCVEFLPSASVDLSGTDSALYPFDPQQENFQEFWFPPTSMYPYFLFPATASTRTFKEHERYHEVPEVPRQENGISFRKPVKGNDPDPDRGQHGPDGQSHGNRAHYGRGGEEKSTRPQEEQHSNQNSVDVEGGLLSKHGLPGTEHRHLSKSEHDHQHHVYEHQNRLHHQHNYSHRHHSLAPHPTPTVDESPPPLQDHVAPAPGHQGKKFAPRPTYEHRALVEDMDDLDDNELRLGKLPIDRLFDLQEAFEGFVDQGSYLPQGRVQEQAHEPFLVKVISHPDNSTSFELIESQLENPLIDADHQDLHALKQLPLPGLHHQRVLHGKNHSLLEDHGNSGSPLIIPSPVSDAEKAAAKLPVMLTLTSTCHHAYTSCKNDADCRRAMQPVLSHCDLASCARNACMDALQNFYKSASQKHSMEIAFCLCKKTDSNRDDCILAQEKMHPLCAQRVEGAEMPTCHSLAEICREDRACRTRLEYYEQSCAVDSVTKKCAGAPAECRKAMIGILGTDLRSNCACKGTDFTQLYDCLGWQRLLWVNPCVVESQKDYHARRKHHHQRTTTTPVTSTGTTSTMTSVVKPEQVNLIPEVTQKPLTEATEVWEISTEVSTTESTTMSSTTPPRFCVVQRPRQTHQYIREGRGKRLYRDDEPECSELCQCGIGEVLVCNTICVESSPCKTDFAFYNHAAPAYQAYRGRCLCYSGRFICMRPSPDSYSIPHGVFMFLGYSEADESLLRPHSNLTVMDAVSSLDHFMRQEVNNQTVCTLFLYNVTRENVIAAARLGNDNAPLNGSQASNLQHLLRIKEECSSMLQELSDKINNRHHELHSHPLLSIFKMAEVEIKLPQSSKGRTTRMTNDLLILALIASFLMAWDSGHFMLMGSTLQTDACNHRS